jgi:hypothetical protein
VRIENWKDASCRGIAEDRNEVVLDRGTADSSNLLSYRDTFPKIEPGAMPDSPARAEGPMVSPRAFSLLRLLADHQEGRTLSDIAVPKSSLLSALQALTDPRYLSRKGIVYFLSGISDPCRPHVAADRPPIP